MNIARWAIGILIAVMLVALAYFALNDILGLGHSYPAGEPAPSEEVGGETDEPRRALPPEIYLNGPAGSERIQSGSTRVLTGNISLTFKFTEPVNIEAEGGFSVESAQSGKVERFSIGYGGVDRTTVLIDIPPADYDKEALQVRIDRHVFLDPSAFLREPVVLYMDRYAASRSDIKQVSADGTLIEPEAWVTEGTKVYNIRFDRPVNMASVEKAVRKNATDGDESEKPQIAFEWKDDTEAEIVFEDLPEGTYHINVTGAEDLIGLRMQGLCGVGNCLSFNAGKTQSIAAYDMESGEMETLGGEAFDEVRYLSGRIDGGEIILHKYNLLDTESEKPLLFKKTVYDENTGRAEAVEERGSLKEYYEPLLKAGWKFRGVKPSPSGETVAAFASGNEIGPEGRLAELLLIDVESETVLRKIEMPFYIYAPGDGVFPMDLHFDWISDSIIFTEGFTMLGNTANIYGINIETGVVVPLKKNAREPRFVEGLKLLSAIEMEKTGEGTIRRDGEEEQKINYYSDSGVVLLGIYGNKLKEYDGIEGYAPYARARECGSYDSLGSIIWSHENKLVYPEKIGGNSTLVIQNLGNGKTEKVDIGMDFVFLGIREGKAYLLEETKKN